MIEDIGQWETLAVDTDYEIFNQMPYPIRRKDTGRIISEWLNDGYPKIKLNGVRYSKHRIIAIQWLPNPNDLPEVDHINTIRMDYRLENLRWVTRNENQMNKAHDGDHQFTYLNDLPDGTDSLDSYGIHDLDGYWINRELEKVYIWNGARYRQLDPYSHRGYIVYAARDIEGKRFELVHRVLFG